MKFKIFVSCFLFVNITSAQEIIKVKNSTLSIQYEGKIDSLIFDIKGGDRIKLPELKDNFWEASIYIENVEELILQYKFVKFYNGSETSSDYKLWENKGLPKLHKETKIVKGRVIEDTIWSNALGEDRKLTIYLPQNYDETKAYPIIYLADGKIVRKYAPFVEHLIDNKTISEIIMVGVHSGETPKKDMLDMSKNKRTLEYLIGIDKYIPKADSTRFNKHLKFFCEEVIEYVNNNYPEEVQKRLLYGFSNGASFSISASLAYPHLYKNVVAFSVGWEMALEESKITNDFPNFYLTAGTLEKDFYAITKKWADILEDKNKNVYFKKAISYHDEIMWREEFLKTIKKIYK